MLRDLQWLFNTINNEAQQDLSAFGEVQRSVWNFGVAPLAGQNISDIEWQDMQRKMTDAILHFEPRILPQGLQVRCVSDLKSLSLHNVLSIEIKGRLWCVPYPLEFLFRTRLIWKAVILNYWMQVNHGQQTARLLQPRTGLSA